MRPILLPVHIAAGLLAIATGYVALYALKGARIHKKSGIIFVYAMVILGASGAWLGVLKSQPGNIAGGAIAIYLVITGLMTLRPRDENSRVVDLGTSAAAFSISAFCFTTGVKALHSPGGAINGVPYQMSFLLGTVTFLAAGGDIRSAIVNGFRGSHRIARHLWRMCFAMFVATGSFFIGQAKVFPKPMRIFPLLALPVLLVILTMFYWMYRVSFTKWYRRRAIDSLKPVTLHQTA